MINQHEVRFLTGALILSVLGLAATVAFLLGKAVSRFPREMAMFAGGVGVALAAAYGLGYAAEVYYRD